MRCLGGFAFVVMLCHSTCVPTLYKVSCILLVLHHMITYSIYAHLTIALLVDDWFARSVCVCVCVCVYFLELYYYVPMINNLLSPV